MRTIQRQTNGIACKIAVMAIAVIAAVMGVVKSAPVSAYAEVREYTGVRTDLARSEAFNESDYPDNGTDYTVSVIQIAESTNNELFVYTYQPCQKSTYITATEINMSLSETVGATRLYALTLVNSSGVFCKYKVEGITVSGEPVRYYNITSIYREWISGVDKPSDNDNTKNAVAFNVGKLYRATTENGEVKYRCKQTDTIEIIDPYADHLEYANGFKLYGSWCDSHYVAFSTDRKIDTLQEADVFFSYVRVDRDMNFGKDYPDESTRGSRVHKLNGEQKGGNPADGFLAKKYEWERIQSVDEFIRTEELKAETKKNLKDKQWVLRFCETERKQYWGDTNRRPQLNGPVLWQIRTNVNNVTILRLKFVTDGKVYDLGAVADKVTGDSEPGNNNTNELAGVFEWLERVTGIPQWAWILLFVLLIIGIALPILSVIFPAVGRAVLWIFNGLWWLISTPFKWLFGKIAGDGDGAE